jgi:hypothetical protein
VEGLWIEFSLLEQALIYVNQFNFEFDHPYHYSPYRPFVSFSLIHENVGSIQLIVLIQNRRNITELILPTRYQGQIDQNFWREK